MHTKYGLLGATGFLGTHILHQLENAGQIVIKGSRRLGIDARSITSLTDWITEHQITTIINLAAECGGIGLNKLHPSKLWLSTTLITAAVLEAARLNKISKLCMIGTVCSYARNCPTPFRETDLMHHGPPESTNGAYGVAKLNSLFGCQAYRQEFGLNAIYLIPVNLYGPGDNFSPDSSHVIPALVRKCIEARESGIATITCWGTGTATREFLYVEDAARAIIMASEHYNEPEPINIGIGIEIPIAELVELIAKLCRFTGTIKWDSSKPDGQPQRCLDTSQAAAKFGFKAQTTLEEGLAKTIEWYERSHL